jgi:hypothetical protein
MVKTCRKWRTGAGAEIIGSIAKIAKIAEIETHFLAAAGFQLLIRQFGDYGNFPMIRQFCFNRES